MKPYIVLVLVLVCHLQCACHFLCKIACIYIIYFFSICTSTLSTRCLIKASLEYVWSDDWCFNGFDLVASIESGMNNSQRSVWFSYFYSTMLFNISDWNLNNMTVWATKYSEKLFSYTINMYRLKYTYEDDIWGLDLHISDAAMLFSNLCDLFVDT